MAGSILANRSDLRNGGYILSLEFSNFVPQSEQPACQKLACPKLLTNY